MPCQTRDSDLQVITVILRLQVAGSGGPGPARHGVPDSGRAAASLPVSGPARGASAQAGRQSRYDCLSARRWLGARRRHGHGVPSLAIRARTVTSLSHGARRPDSGKMPARAGPPALNKENMNLCKLSFSWHPWVPVRRRPRRAALVTGGPMITAGRLGCHHDASPALAVFLHWPSGPGLPPEDAGHQN
jgi:hypothetical protein